MRKENKSKKKKELPFFVEEMFGETMVNRMNTRSSAARFLAKNSQSVDEHEDEIPPEVQFLYDMMQ